VVGDALGIRRHSIYLGAWGAVVCHAQRHRIHGKSARETAATGKSMARLSASEKPELISGRTDMTLRLQEYRSRCLQYRIRVLIALLIAGC